MKRTIAVALLMALILPVLLMGISAEAATILIWPVPGHTRLSRGYSDSHKALDINDSSIKGATIVAAMSGKIVRVSKCTKQHYGSSGDCGGTGTGLAIKGDDGRYYSYAHMLPNSIPSNFAVGTYVTAGTKIGLVGTTGNSSGPHLHFSIATGSNYLDNRINPAKETYDYSYNGAPLCSYTELPDRMSVSDTDAVIAMKLNKPVGSTIEQYGARLYNNGALIGAVSDTSSGLTSSSYAEQWWTISSSMGLTLRKGHNYTFEFWATVDGVTYTSDHQSFTTTGTAEHSVTCYDNYSGKNYFVNSDFLNGLDTVRYQSRDTSVYTLSVDGTVKHNPQYNTLKIQAAAAGASGKDLTFGLSGNGSCGHQYYFGDMDTKTMSFWAKSSVAGAKMYVRWGWESTASYRSVELTTDWAYYTIEMPREVTFGTNIHPYFSTAGTFWLSELQMEDGTVATEFVPEAGGNTELVAKEGETYSNLPTPRREGYTFDGWYTRANGGDLIANTSDVMDGDMALYAHWTKEAEVVPTLTLKNPTLAFEDEILYNVYFNVDDMSNVAEMGMVTFAERDVDGTVDNALEVIPGYVANADGSYTVHSNGIPAKMLGDAVYFKIYAKLSDGSYVYSGIAGYHAVLYANTVLKSDAASAKAKALVVAMLNYGAAAQVDFDYKADSLMNAGLTAEQLALVEAYSESMVAQVPAAGDKAGGFVLNNGYSDVHPTVSFEGAFSINYYFTPKYTPDDGVTFYYWNLNDFNNAEVLTPANATGTVKMTSATGVYTAPVEGIAAKQIDEPVYVAALYTNGGMSYTTPVIGYSLGNYCKNIAANGNAFGAATAVYGYYAKAYFAN